MEWFDEKVERVKDDKFLYKFICFFLGGPKKRLSYKELFILIYGLNLLILCVNDTFTW